MEQRLTLYRRHGRHCTRGYATDDRIYENDSRPDCQCGIVASGNLTHEPKRILHRVTGADNWPEARRIRDLWLDWGATTDETQLADGRRITVEQATQEFFRHSKATRKRGHSTKIKYQIFFNSRLLTWCKARGIRFIAEFDDRNVVRKFFYSWKNLQPVRGKVVTENDPKIELADSTIRTELERYRGFLSFCQVNGWIKANHAKTVVDAPAAATTKKVAWTLEEYDNVLQTFREWKDRYHRKAPRARRQNLFALLLGATGQRICDVAMLGPDSLVADPDGKYFIQLQQIKTGKHVSIPVDDDVLIAELQTLPILGRTKEPFSFYSNHRMIRYGTDFWFWTAKLPDFPDGMSADERREKISEIVEQNAKNWSDDINRVLRHCEQTHGRFKHPATAHTFRHFFAIQMLTDRVSEELVSRWLGHSSVLITRRHYGHANADMNDQAYEEMRRAMEARRQRAKRKKVVPLTRKAG